MKNSIKALLRLSTKALCLSSLVALVGCGQQRGALEAGQSDTSIIGGKPVRAGSAIANTTVGLIDVKTGSSCTASILSSKFILTAAHCVAGSNPANVRVVFGTELSPKGTIRKVAGYKFHSKWLNAKSAKQRDLGDIAVVMFEGGLPDGYRSAQLLTDSSVIQKDSTVLLAGFGYTNGVAKTGSGTLRGVIVKVEDPAFSPTEVMLDQSKGKGACQGDSGGPAYIQDKSGKILLFGVTSRGEADPKNTCGEKSVYTNATAYIPWIKAAAAALNKAAKESKVASLN